MLIPFLSGGENVTPEVTEQSSIIDSIMTALVGKVTEANATPETILEGYKAWVNGELITGTLKAGLGLDTISKMECGTLTGTGSKITDVTITHNLGVVPKVFIIFSLDAVSGNGIYAAIDHASAASNATAYINSSGNAYYGEFETTTTTAKFTTGYAGTETYGSGMTYTWLAIA